MPKQVTISIADTTVIASLNDKGEVFAVHTPEGRLLGQSVYTDRKQLFECIQLELLTREILNASSNRSSNRSSV